MKEQEKELSTSDYLEEILDNCHELQAIISGMTAICRCIQRDGGFMYFEPGSIGTLCSNCRSFTEKIHDAVDVLDHQFVTNGKLVRESSIKA